MGALQDAFQAMLARDGVNVFAGGEFGETITYRAKGNATTDKTINANVFRQQLAPVPGVIHGLAPMTQVWVAAADVPNPQAGDEFIFAEQIGGTPRRHAFTKRLKEDAGGFLLEVR